MVSDNENIQTATSRELGRSDHQRGLGLEISFRSRAVRKDRWSAGPRCGAPVPGDEPTILQCMNAAQQKDQI